MLVDVNRFYSPKELIVENGGILPISLSAVYNAIAKNQIPSVELGSRKLIPGAFLKDFSTTTIKHQSWVLQDFKELIHSAPIYYNEVLKNEKLQWRRNNLLWQKS